MFTTDGINFSARSAKDAGTGLELTFNKKEVQHENITDQKQQSNEDSDQLS